MYTVFIILVLLISAAVQLIFTLASWTVFYKIVRYWEKVNENAYNRKPNPNN